MNLNFLEGKFIGCGVTFEHLCIGTFQWSHRDKEKHQSSYFSNSSLQEEAMLMYTKKNGRELHHVVMGSFKIHQNCLLYKNVKSNLIPRSVSTDLHCFYLLDVTPDDGCSHFPAQTPAGISINHCLSGSTNPTFQRNVVRNRFKSTSPSQNDG